MTRPIYNFTKYILTNVSFDTTLFQKELKKALDYLLPYEIELLIEWLYNYTKNKPELKEIVVKLT